MSNHASLNRRKSTSGITLETQPTQKEDEDAVTTVEGGNSSDTIKVIKI